MRGPKWKLLTFLKRAQGRGIVTIGVIDNGGVVDNNVATLLRTRHYTVEVSLNKTG